MFGHSAFSEAPFSSEGTRKVDIACFMSAQSGVSVHARRVRQDNPTLASNMVMSCNPNVTFSANATLAFQTSFASDSDRIRTILPTIAMETSVSSNNVRVRLDNATATPTLSSSITAIGIFSGDTTLLSESDIIGAIRLLWEQEGITPETWVSHTQPPEIWTDVTIQNETWANNNPPPYGH